MGKIFCIMGKSASGKDSIYRELLKMNPSLGTYVMYTTRPMREGETEGVTYFYTDEEKLSVFAREGKMIESRTYDTVYGPWTYATVDDGQIDLSERDYLIPGTLESFQKLKEYFGEDQLIPIYIEVEDGERLLRAIKREQLEAKPKYKEVCRRFIADSEDFSEEKLLEAGIYKRYENKNMYKCAEIILNNMLNVDKS